MNQYRITRLHVSGFKSLADVELPLDGLSVLIGENGAGKSALLEALLILTSAAERLVHVQDVVERRFGRFDRILTGGSSVLCIEASFSSREGELHYGFSMGSAGAYPVVLDEWIYKGALHPRLDENLLLSRKGEMCTFLRKDGSREELRLGEQALALGYVGAGASGSIAELLDALESIQNHAPFDARPLWQQQELGVTKGPRRPQAIVPAPRLRRYGVNLASAYHQLRNTGGDTWDRVIGLARLGLGEDLRDIRLPATGNGQIELELQFATLPRPLPAEALSEGQICYLGFIALAELNASRAALAIDECELHLHPQLLARVVWMLEDAAKNSPVLLSTHANQILDALEDPAKSVILCELDENRRTVLRRVNSDALGKWLKNYAGLGTLRADGHEGRVFLPAQTAGVTEAT